MNLLTKSELLKLRCSPEERQLLFALLAKEVEKRGGEKVSYSEIIRQAILLMAKQQLGEGKVKDIIKANDDCLKYSNLVRK